MNISTFLPTTQQKPGKNGDLVYTIALRHMDHHLSTQPRDHLVGKITLEPERLLKLAAKNNLTQAGIYILENSDLIRSEIVFTSLDTLIKTTRPIQKIITANSMCKTKKTLLQSYQAIYSKLICEIIDDHSLEQIPKLQPVTPDKKAK